MGLLPKTVYARGLCPGGGGGGGGHSGSEGGRTRVTYFVEEGVFFKTSACPRFY